MLDIIIDGISDFLDSRALKAAALLAMAAAAGYILIPGVLYLIQAGAF